MRIGAPPEKWLPMLGKTERDYRPLLGMELELFHERGYDEEQLSRFRSRLDTEQQCFLAAAMYDASVHGAEFVTNPASLDIHAKFWPGLIESLVEFGFVVKPNSGGLHVHVSKTGMLPGQLTILLALVIYGGQDWERFQELVHGRTGIRWAAGVPAARACPDNFQASWKLAESYIQEFHNNPNYTKRYVRLNLVPTETLEFRQGHATLSYRRIMTRLEFVDAMMAFTHTACRKGPLHKLFNRGLPSVRGFLQWVERQDRWPHLLESS
ncbi:hypothetical protein ACJU26_09340 [Acidithiobacillus sp. M4-SHS-6]|uniref:hypothetical protein n=1 Tax=Acidithiobacillus sp. M4-SHS-6 TaxID=3383024 RepID=UPI0039BE5888